MIYYYLLSFILLGSALALLVIMWYKNKKKYLKLEPNNSFNYAILIPARDESRVIEELLKSIKKQVPSMKDTYVIVEDKKDKTCDIVKKYGGNILLRTDLTKRRKGYALDEGIKEILKTKHYDLYFIFDADNILDEHYIEEMLNTYKKGYKIATGYRNIKNNSNVVTSCSGLTFSMINTLINKTKVKLNKTIIISGTGYYISGDLIELWQGFPFNSLTEDYELSLYATANNIATYYNENAIFYDEQPTNMKTSITQRTRWVKGFFESRKKRLKEIKGDFSKFIGVTPYILLILSAIFGIIVSLGKLIQDIIIGNNNYIIYLSLIIIILFSIYLILVLFTIIMLKKEKGKLNISNSLKLKTIFFNPLFLLSYVVCLVKAITTNVGWDIIEHGK